MRRDLGRGHVFDEVTEAGFFKVITEVAIAIMFWAGITITWIIVFGQGKAMLSGFSMPSVNICDVSPRSCGGEVDKVAITARQKVVSPVLEKTVANMAPAIEAGSVDMPAQDDPFITVNE